MVQRSLLTLLLILLGFTGGGAPVWVRTMTGDSVRGVWKSMDADGTLSLIGADGAEKRLAMKETATLAFPQTKLAVKTTSGIRFELVTGDVIIGDIVESTFDDVTIKSNALADVIKLPLDRVHLVVVNENAGTLAPTFGDDVAKDRDVLFMRTKEGIDHVVGEVAKLDPAAIVFNWGDKQESTFSFAKDKVIALRLASEAAPERAKTPYGIVHQRDGGVLAGQIGKKADGPATIDLGGGLVAALREEEIVEIAFINGDFTFLSDLPRPAITETPFVQGGILYGIGLDRGLDGDALTIGEEFFSKGVAVHSKTELVYALDGKYKTFTTAIGIDGAVKDRLMRGAVTFTIKADDAVVFGPKVMRAGEAAQWIGAIDVAQKKSLTLIADFADNLHFNGRAVFGGARLVNARP